MRLQSVFMEMMLPLSSCLPGKGSLAVERVIFLDPKRSIDYDFFF